MPMPLLDTLAVSATTFGLVAAAEMGDKTQLVCMTLAVRQRGLPVLAGAVTAFALLNLLAVLFGAALAAWLPEALIAAVVAVLFVGFGVRTLLDGGGEDDCELAANSVGSVFWSAFAMIFLAELGDKTQLAVAGLASTQASVPVWIGATLALAGTSALGVWAGRTLLQRVSLTWVQRVSGALFLLLGGAAGWQALRLWVA